MVGQPFRKKDDLLPTILFILAAYALYALVMWWCRWQRSHLWARRNQTRSRWLTLMGSAGILGLFLCLLVWLAPASPHQSLRLAGILGLSEVEMRLAKQATSAAASLQPESKPTNGQPAYALLHPASPPSLLPPAKPLTGNQLRKPKGKGASVSKPPHPKAESKLQKKDKASPKSNALKKKTSPSSSKKSEGGAG
jgi:outer membrane biosynthesis protein TonB